jgi:ABC-type spermidine/putrescine transport system permease subunit II
VRIWTQIRFGVRPTINAIGTSMLVISMLSIGLALLLRACSAGARAD